MQTNLIPLYQDSSEGQRAEEILRSCVHCGFCNATCPTYQVVGDELDGPRGRIYQIKQLLEGGEVSDHTRERFRSLPQLQGLRNHVSVRRSVTRVARYR